MDRFSEYQNDTGKYESLYTFILHDITVEETLEHLRHQLKKINTIGNKFKKRFLNDRMYMFITDLEEGHYGDDKLNSVFLVGEEVHDLPLRKKELQIARDYDIPKYNFVYGGSYAIEYLNDLFTDLNFYNIIHLRNNVLKYYQINSTKKKLVDTVESKKIDVVKYIEEKGINKCLVYGNFTGVKTLTIPGHLVMSGNPTWEGIIKKFKIEEAKENHKLLREALKMADKEDTMHRLVYKKQVPGAINEYKLEKLFLTPSNYEKIKNKFNKEQLNFKIYEIEMVKHGDLGDSFQKDYEGALGVTYY